MDVRDPTKTGRFLTFLGGLIPSFLTEMHRFDKNILVAKVVKPR